MGVLQDATGKECGLHSGNVVESAAEQAKDDQRDLWQEGAVEALSKEQLQDIVDGKRDKNTMLVMYAPWCQYSQVTALPHGIVMICLGLRLHIIVGVLIHGLGDWIVHCRRSMGCSLPGFPKGTPCVHSTTEFCDGGYIP